MTDNFLNEIMKLEDHDEINGAIQKVDKQLSKLDTGGSHGPDKDFDRPNKFLTEDNIVNFDDFMTRNIPTPQPLISGLLDEKNSMLVHAQSGEGKSLVALALALFCAGKSDTMGFWDNSFGGHKTLYLDGEIDLYEAQRRTKALSSAMDITAPDFHYLNVISNKLWDLHLLNPDVQDEIIRFISENKIKLIVIDNIRSLAFGDDENSSSSMSSLNKFVDKIHSAGGSAIVIHHSNKAKTHDGWPVFAGSSNFERPYSVVMALKTEQRFSKEDPKQIMNFLITKQRSNNIACHEGSITLCDVDGVSVERKTEAVATMSPQDEDILNKLTKAFPEILDDDFEFEHGMANGTWLKYGASYIGKQGYKQSGGKNINKLLLHLKTEHHRCSVNTNPL